jgi:hypothetical protein
MIPQWFKRGVDHSDYVGVLNVSRSRRADRMGCVGKIAKKKGDDASMERRRCIRRRHDKRDKLGKCSERAQSHCMYAGMSTEWDM